MSQLLQQLQGVPLSQGNLAASLSNIVQVGGGAGRKQLVWQLAADVRFAKACQAAAHCSVV